MINNIIDHIKKENLIVRIILFIIGVFINAMNYNLFVVPNSFVLGGAGGIAIILEKSFGFNHVISIFVINIILIVLCYFLLDKKETRRAIVGSLLYPLFISLTAPLCAYLLPHVNFHNFLITLLLCGVLSGVGNGLVYKVGYNTGGGDIIVKLANKYLSLSEGTAALWSNTIILMCGAIVFGFTIVIYSILIIVLSASLLDKILIGISDCKMFFIYSKKFEEIEKYIIEELHTGVTLFNTEGAYKKQKREMLMIVIPTRDYYKVKNQVLKIDSDAFFVVSDCYEVSGGKKRKNLPFISVE